MTPTRESSPPVVTRPVAATLNPATAVHGGVDLTMHVTGSGFSSSSVIWFNNAAAATTFVNAGDVTMLVKPSLFAAAGGANVFVKTKGMASNALNFVFT